MGPHNAIASAVCPCVKFMLWVSSREAPILHGFMWAFATPLLRFSSFDLTGVRGIQQTFRRFQKAMIGAVLVPSKVSMFSSCFGSTYPICHAPLTISRSTLSLAHLALLFLFRLPICCALLVFYEYRITPTCHGPVYPTLPIPPGLAVCRHAVCLRRHCSRRHRS